MIELILQNLEFLIPQFLLSLYGAFLVVHAFFWLKDNTLNTSLFNDSLEELKSGHVKSVYDSLSSNSVEKKIMTHAVSFIQKGRGGNLKDELYHLTSKFFSPLLSDLSALYTLANVSTLMGLLGTVVGMIVAFNKMKQTGESNPFILAGGISKALVTTAFGLLIAICLLLLRFYLKRQTMKKEGNIEILIEHFHSKVVEK